MILWKHILRAVIGPFLFSNTVIIFLFLLQFLMKSAGDIVGKGLSIWVIIELIALNLAWMVVLAVPMSVLVASLMAFGKMSADNETTIMRASGMSLYRMMLPVLVFAGLVTAGLIVFNNDILPESNIRLRTLMGDVLRKKPTLSIQAGVFTNEEQLPNYRILVRKTFENSNDLEGVTIYDLSVPEEHVVVTAEEGTVSFSPDYSKIFMDLRDGEIHQVSDSEPNKYRRLKFKRHRVAIPASGFGFERTDATNARRDDRTMSAAMMMDVVDSVRIQRARKDSIMNTRIENNLSEKFSATIEVVPRNPSAARRLNAWEQRRRVDYSEMKTTDSALVKPDTAFVPTAKDTLRAANRAMGEIEQFRSYIQGDAGGINYDNREIDKYLVEVYKKYSIPVACIVFVFVGVPLGMMARRGGFGVGAGLSLGFFLFYWACLIGGEKLADRQVLSPFWGMWAGNIVLGIVGALLTLKAGKELTIINWSKFARFVPKAFRSPETNDQNNPREAS